MRKKTKSGKVREKWTDILPRYLTFISHMKPILKETRRIIINIVNEDPDLLLSPMILNSIREEEEKRNIRTVRALSEFSAMYRTNIYTIMTQFIEEFKDKLVPIDLGDYIIDHLKESIEALDILQQITNPDQKNWQNTYLYLLVKFIEDLIFPQGGDIPSIYKKLLNNAWNYFECQRHLLIPHTYYREKLEKPDSFEIPGMSPKLYQIINNITSLFNLDPNYGDFPEKNGFEIPMVIKNEVFAPFIDSIANAEQEAVENIVERIGLRIIDDIFLAPQESFIDILDTNLFIRKVIQDSGNARYIPQFNNETLILYYSAFASKRRGFLSKELVNWISMNFAFIIYMGILKWKLNDENIFYGIFKDLQTNEKVIPYLMKLICFPKYLALDKMKIRDSVQYRKEIFNFIGSQIDNLKDLINNIANYLTTI